MPSPCSVSWHVDTVAARKKEHLERGLKHRLAAGRAVPVRRLVAHPRARPLRFAFTGGSAAAVQLVLLALLSRAGWLPLAANAFGFLVGIQVNFVLSSIFTWHDRFEWGKIPRRWALFHLAAASTGVLNLGTFAVVHHLFPVVPTLIAGALGLVIASIANFLIGDRVVFRHSGD